MDDTKFRKTVALAVKLMEIQRKMTEKSDKRILRDTIRALVKEITRVE